MEFIKAIKRKMKIFWSKEHKKIDLFTGITLLLLMGIFAYSFFNTHTVTLGAEDTISMFSEEPELTGFAVRGETAERTTTVSEDVGTTEIEESTITETTPISTTRTITRQSSTTTPSTGSSSTTSRTASTTASRTSFTQSGSSISRIVSPTKVTRETGTLSEEKTITNNTL